MSSKRAKNAKDIFNIPWEDLLYYDETSPSGIRHARTITYGNGNTLIKAYKGDIAGGLGEGGYYVYSSNKYGTFLVHRIIWVLYYKQDIPVDCIIDHEDGDRTNNSIYNLRLVNEQRNTRNAKMYKNNTTGIVGVYFDTKKYPNSDNHRYYWKASWMELDGVQKTKAFSICKYGLIPAMKMAYDFRKAQIERLNSQDAGYSERHGT